METLDMRVKDHLKLSVQSNSSQMGDQDHEDTWSIGSASHSGSLRSKHWTSKTGSRYIALFAVLVVLVGFAASASFLYLGITSANNDEQDQFDRRATEVAQELKSAWEDYEVAGLWIHESCRKRDFGRQDFRALYDYIRSDGLEFQAAEYIPNVTSEERQAIEVEDKKFYEEYYPDVVFHGFKGFEPDPEGGMSVQNRSEQPFYFPVRYVEPVMPNAVAAGFDLYSSASRKATIHQALDTWKPALTDRLRLVQETDPSAYSVLLMHPGVSLEYTEPNLVPRDVSLMVIRIPALLERASRNQVESFGMYLYDKTVEGPPQFLGAVGVSVTKLQDTSLEEESNATAALIRTVEFLPELELEELLQEQSGNKLKREDIEASSKTWEVVVFPVNDAYDPNLTIILITGVIIAVAAGALAICLYVNMKRVTAMNKIILQAQADKAIVTNLFPSNVRRRLMEEADHRHNHQNHLTDGTSKTAFKGSMSGAGDSSTIFGSSPIAELYPETTILFADIVGFTAWSSIRDPTQVFSLLEVLYNGFDVIAKRRGVFKVETIGDCYVACAGLPHPRKDHALIMARFSVDIMLKMSELTQGLETALGPDTSDLALRIGVHSGPVTAGVLRGDKGRFQLFGDSMNTASRMESTGQSGKIHLSEATAHLLQEAGKGDWLESTKTVVHAKGIGHISTFWINIQAIAGDQAKIFQAGARAKSERRFNHGSSSSYSNQVFDEKTQKFVAWNVKSLERILRQIVVRHQVSFHKKGMFGHHSKHNPTKATPNRHGGMLLDEVKDVIKMPEFDPKTVAKAEEIDPTTVEIEPSVLSQLRDYVTRIALLYHQDNPFHNFEHASHVTMSVTKLLSRIVNPKLTEIKNTTKEKGTYQVTDTLAMLHDHTFGITSDPVTQFACVFAAVIHDADHTGLPNAVLVKEGTSIAKKYHNKSVAEQNSLELALNMLMEGKYEALRGCLFEDAEDLQHFRAVLTNSVMATDIMDKQLGAARKKRWEKAFAGGSGPGSEEETHPAQAEESTNRKATIVIEHLIQASDVAHTMQHWHIYRKWNERLFFELYNAYNIGKLENDPSTSWYKGEIGFFDYYIIPLAKKLKDCGVFGVSSDEYLAYALDNRREWEEKGEEITKEYLKKYEESREKVPGDEDFTELEWC